MASKEERIYRIQKKCLNGVHQMAKVSLGGIFRVAIICDKCQARITEIEGEK
jgi:hypothetical protein